MNNLIDYVKQALKEGRAIGHFNISNSDGFWAVVNAQKKFSEKKGYKVPIIIGVSEGERDFIGVHTLSAMIKAEREKSGMPLFVNADHTYSYEKVKEVVDAGFDAVIFDGTELPFEQNVIETKKCKEYIMSKNPSMLLEAELGFIGKSSKMLDKIPEGVELSEEYLTQPEDALHFIQETGSDMLAPAVGNIHGMLKGGKNPALNTNQVKKISEIIG